MRLARLLHRGNHHLKAGKTPARALSVGANGWVRPHQDRQRAILPLDCASLS
jgi:hypothetical protein